jgi:hypothetical protein
VPKLDECHHQVVHALEKAGWVVAPRPYTLYIDKTHRLHIDIEARFQQKGHVRSVMVVEVKCFDDPDTATTDLYTAIGQYLVYRALLEQKQVAIPLYLAVPEEAYQGIFRRMAMPVIQQNRIKILVVQLSDEVIAQWLD